MRSTFQPDNCDDVLPVPPGLVEYSKHVFFGEMVSHIIGRFGLGEEEMAEMVPGKFRFERAFQMLGRPEVARRLPDGIELCIWVAQRFISAPGGLISNRSEIRLYFRDHILIDPLA